jgi:hypothetical protein
MTAQGNALGKANPNFCTLQGCDQDRRKNLFCPFRANYFVDTSPERCPGLSCICAFSAPQSRRFARFDNHPVKRTASWTAVAERSGDTAFARKKISRTHHHHRAHESGVALRFPPQSKTYLVIPKPKRTRLVLLQFSA